MGANAKLAEAGEELLPARRVLSRGVITASGTAFVMFEVGGEIFWVKVGK